MSTRRQKIVGFSASLRNARNREGARALIEDLVAIKERPELVEYLNRQGNLHLENFFKAGRQQNVPYNELYKKLRSMGGRQGLSNSEICLAACLWGASSIGAEIDQIPLMDYFHSDGTSTNLDQLDEMLFTADGIVISSPVYFGDRSSLSQQFIDHLRKMPDAGNPVRGKVYGGLSVGAKRNGGQETTLIYQMHDMLELGLLAVGNDYETTSQYGGTGHAGDVATMPKDEYGVSTCIGVGRRVARVADFLSLSGRRRLKDKLRVGVLIFQNRGDVVQDTMQPFIDRYSDLASFDIVNCASFSILPCLGCDICPCKVGKDEEFRCIRKKTDDMHTIHDLLFSYDVLVVAMYSPRDREGLVSTYQQFVERTRYMRRGDYALSDRLIVPLVLSEVGATENLNLRITTSFIRHHTVISKPVIGVMQRGAMLNADQFGEDLQSALAQGARLTAGRLAAICQHGKVPLYKPVGYVLAMAKDNTDEVMHLRAKAIEHRIQRLREEGERRLDDCAEP